MNELEIALQTQVETAYKTFEELAEHGFSHYEGTPPASFEGDWRLGMDHETYSGIMEFVEKHPSMTDKTAQEILNTNIQPILREFAQDYSQTGYPLEDFDLKALLSDEACAQIDCTRLGINGNGIELAPQYQEQTAPSNGYDQPDANPPLPTPKIDLDDTSKGPWL